jgi:hypothetical protein
LRYFFIFFASASILILLLTTSSAIITDELSNGFFHFGRAFPFYYAVCGLHFIYFGSPPKKMWINCIVLAAWMLIPLTATSVITARCLNKQRQPVFSVPGLGQKIIITTAINISN